MADKLIPRTASAEIPDTQTGHAKAEHGRELEYCKNLQCAVKLALKEILIKKKLSLF